MAERYVVPNWFTRNVFNRAVAGFTRLGISVWGSRILEVRGRKSGEPRRTPVNMLTLDGTTYLVAPRGHTQWVRNLRVASEGDLLLGRRRQHFVAAEVPETEKEPILRAYLERWKWEVGQFFGGVGADSPSEKLRRIAPDHPVFRIELKEPDAAAGSSPRSEASRR
jgi:deazaflavin-dependent oxidoreductase (nitroreductase family)